MTELTIPVPDDIQIVAFDLDDTLAASKSPVQPEMAATLRDLLAVRPVCIISGGRYEQFQAQVLDNLPTDADLSRLHLMPTCGTRYLRHIDGAWTQIYAHDLDEADKAAAIASLEKRAKELGVWEPDEKCKGDRIEDRGSQITFSALGQQASVADKHAWDPDMTKRGALRDAVAADVPQLEVRSGGSTSIDITQKGIDKAHGMRALTEQTGIQPENMLFIGDRLQPGGNDYPVYEMGIACHAVEGPQDTIGYVRSLIDGFQKA
ncbi:MULTISPECIES: HAD-IIB family hydrolase [Luteococcus]|uniref:phosphomannomutase n=1 Tax=Luteococcus japonicus LSP_Lj1 TaxID=1255658 RepID=A0A1R4KJW9_9ACTN|nr:MULTISPECIES: HAD-IIB family hydrolase [Luteococcus]MDN5562596.1 HAD-IIB family hydrolase [Luteococcus sp.]SJN44525.1 Phosphoglucomutase [Luteococcus japonicus LSP_Lj1]